MSSPTASAPLTVNADPRFGMREDQDAGMATLVAAHDWSATGLGAAENWSPVLASVVELVLAHGFPSVLLWGPELIQVYNDGYRVIMGDKHPAGLGRPTTACWPEVWHINQPIYDRVRAGETLTFEDKLYPITRHGPLEDAWFTLTYIPVREDGRVAGILVTVFETTATHQTAAGRDLIESELRASEQRFRAFVTASTDAVYRMSADWSEMRALDGRGVLADTPAPTSDWQRDYILDEDWPRVSGAIRHAVETGEIFDLEHRVRQADGSVGWTHSRAVPIVDADGIVVEWLGAASDITTRKRAEAEAALRDREERLSMLVAELQHRTRNLLSVVSGIAERSRTNSESVDEFCVRLDQRLAALGRVQGLLSTEPLPGIAVDELIALELHAHGLDVAPDGAIQLTGPSIALPADTVQLLALAVHELTTNAMKHGALRQGGRIAIDWALLADADGERRLALRWVESGVTLAASERPRGFGRELIEVDLPFELDATTALDFAPDGVTCRIEMALPPAAD